jgi:osmotically inducible lipoprotein OsmB
MKKVLAAAIISMPLAACHTPADPALTGAVVGGATGAAIGGVATGRAGGALVGGAIGATTGAVIGSASRPQTQCEWDPYYGREVCYRYWRNLSRVGLRCETFPWWGIVMTNKDMVPRPGPGPSPRDRNAPKEPKRLDPKAANAGLTESDLNDPPDSPQLKPSQDKK